MANLIMCPRVDEAPKYKPELQPEQRPCDKCGDPMWIAKSSRDMIANHPETQWVVVCNPCAQAELAKQKERFPDHVVPLAVAETVQPDFVEKLQRTVERINRERGYEPDKEG